MPFFASAFLLRIALVFSWVLAGALGARRSDSPVTVEFSCCLPPMMSAKEGIVAKLNDGFASADTDGSSDSRAKAPECDGGISPAISLEGGTSAREKIGAVAGLFEEVARGSLLVLVAVCGSFTMIDWVGFDAADPLSTSFGTSVVFRCTGFDFVSISQR